MKEDIIRMAREAGAGIGTSGRWLMTQVELERFEALVRADEREECAQVAEKMLRFYTAAVTGVPQAIRARGQDAA
jgi:hypothetical protein